MLFCCRGHQRWSTTRERSGPLFFILYDIISCAESSVEFILFADDTNIFIYAPTTEELSTSSTKIVYLCKLLAHQSKKV